MSGDSVDRLVAALLDEIGATANRDLLLEILTEAAGLVGDGADRLDLKITSAVLKEMRVAFQAFAPYRDTRKVTIFGSARTLADDPSYAHARDLAAAMAAEGWMVITGAGPGIMAAGLEGAGREQSFGVNIRLPFEQDANPFIAGDDKLVSMKYFFTRKLMLIKESRAFVSLPGGFGTLDETYELLTLLQTGKAEPAPIVLLDEPNGTYWTSWLRYAEDEVSRRGFIDDDDLQLVRVTDDVRVAADEILGFYRNYDSLRWVGGMLVIRLRTAPTDDQLRALNEEFDDICTSGRIERSAPFPPEVRSGDRLDLERLALRFNVFRYGRLRAFINALNRL